MTGVLYGLQTGGLDVDSIDRIIGTSAGAAVGAQIAGKTPLSELYFRQVKTEKQVHELVPSINYGRLFLKCIPALLSIGNAEAFRIKMGKMAMNTKTICPDDRLTVIKARLPDHNWPSVNLNIIAVNAENGVSACFNNSSDVGLVDAVAASCAVPGVWPPVKIHDKTYIDGGMRSITNADYADGSKSILIIAPIPRSSLSREVEFLNKKGSDVRVLAPDAQSKKAMGRNPLNPTLRERAARAGYDQGQVEAKQVLAALNW